VQESVISEVSDRALPTTVSWPVALILATLTGTGWFLACTPHDLYLLAWICAVPLLFAIDRAPTFRQAALTGWWAGIVAYCGGFYWIVAVLQRFAGLSLSLSVLLFAAFCLYQGSIVLFFAMCLRALRRRTAAPLALLAALLMAICEWLIPQVFPCGLFITQAWHPLLIQIAEITGPFGVTALLMLVMSALSVTQRVKAGRK